MKKLFFLGAAFAVGLSFTACSSDKDEVAASGTGEVGGNNYIAIDINLPSNPASMTRADDNGGQVTFDDGLATEYEVKDATLLVFDKSSKAFKQAFNLSADAFSTSGTDKQVTSHGTKIIQMVGSNVVAGDLALVVLNNNGLFTLEGNSIKIGGTTFAGDFSAFATTTASTTGLDASAMVGGSSKGFFMANAPLANKPGSTTTAIAAGCEMQVLVPITTLFKTYEDAFAGEADQIYVERGMAKVTMTQAITTATMKNSKLSDNSSLSATIDGWTLDNCNKTSYFVRSTDGHSDFLGLHTLASGGVYRYIGNSAITYPSQPAYPYRSYFAKGTNYDGISDLNTVTGASDFKTSFGENYPQYCFENTFPVSKQTILNTTLVQLKVTAKAGSTAVDLFTAGGNKTVIYNEAGIKGLIQEAVYDYLVANDLVKSGTLNSKDISVTLDTYDATALLTNVVLEYAASVGDATIKGAAFTSNADGTSGTFTQTVKDEVKKKGAIYKYTGGVSYYNIRIKHFGDNLTPWNNGEYATGYAPQNYDATTDNTTAAKIAKIYPNATDGRQANNYLGRYGVLRNNWYNLKVNTINYLGDPVPHTGNWPDTPDDEMENYITFQINILSWAKREQAADL